MKLENLSLDFCRERTTYYFNENDVKFLVAEEELKKYFGLMKRTNKPLAIPSKMVDDIWHAFILFTPQYVSFCNNEFGEYIHHQPNTSETPVPLEALTNFYAEYVAMYGQVHPIWYEDFDSKTVANLKDLKVSPLFAKQYRWSGWPGRS